MGGTIKLESVAGVSTTMTVLLPFDKTSLAEEGMRCDETAAPPALSTFMLLAHDDPSLPKGEDVHILLAEGEHSLL